MADPPAAPSPGLAPVPVRSCDGCTLCCKIFAVPKLAKPRHVWCGYCDAGTGCKIYETRPATRRGFHCGYLLMPNLAEHWKPSRARMVVNVDPGRPEAWRKEPCYGEIKRRALAAVRNRGLLRVWQVRHRRRIRCRCRQRQANVGECRCKWGRGLDPPARRQRIRPRPAAARR